MLNHSRLQPDQIVDTVMLIWDNYPSLTHLHVELRLTITPTTDLGVSQTDVEVSCNPNSMEFCHLAAFVELPQQLAVSLCYYVSVMCGVLLKGKKMVHCHESTLA